MNAMKLMKGAAFMLLAASAWMMVGAPSVSAQTSGADAVKMFDPDNDGTVDLAECKTAGAAMFEKLDTDKSKTLDQQEIGDRGVIGLLESPYRGMSFETRPSKDDYLVLVVRRFHAADPDHDGTLDAKEFETEDGQSLLKLLQ